MTKPEGFMESCDPSDIGGLLKTALMFLVGLLDPPEPPASRDYTFTVDPVLLALALIPVFLYLSFYWMIAADFSRLAFVGKI
jgi:hypothetical protein